MSLTSMVSSSRLSLPSTVLSTTYTVDLYIGKHVKKIWKTCHVNHHNHIIPHPRWKNFNKSDTSWCQQIPWSSRAWCPLSPQCWRPATCMSLMLSYMFQELTKKPFWSYTITTAYHILCSWKIPIEVIPPYVSDLAGLLLHVVLAVHSVIDHQLTYI